MQQISSAFAAPVKEMTIMELHNLRIERKPAALRFKRLSDGRVFDVEGRVAQTVAALVAAGDRGVTALEISTWALRLADYVFKLRRLGLEISMTPEPHDGGNHGRYRLVSAVEIIEMAEAA